MSTRGVFKFKEPPVRRLMTQHPPSYKPHASADFPSSNDEDEFDANAFDAGEHELPILGPRKKEPYWKRIGGGSLGMSVLVHVIFILIAIFLVKFAVDSKKEDVVDFLPGGGGGGQSTQARQAVQRKTVSMNAPKSRITSISPSEITIPDVQTTFSDTSMSGFSLPSGGTGGGQGLGRGLGEGNGIGNGKGLGSGPGFGPGFVSTIFGSMGGKAGLKGSLYDMKQSPEKQELPYDAGVPAYSGIINDSARSHFSTGSLRRYYKAAASMNFSFLAVPRLPAEEGPKAFGVEKEIKPRGWFVHYAGTVTPPDQGPWRFVGFFDDCLMVFVNSRPVLDGSWDKMIFKKDEGIRENFGGPDAAEGGRKNYAGKWFNLKAGDRLDIIVGERPGGLVGGMLLIEKKGEKYEKNPDGTPILPLFSTKILSTEDLDRVSSFSKSMYPYPIAAKIPVFQCSPLSKDRMDKDEMEKDDDK